VRAEGLEPSRSFEHRHLKPARMPFRHARKPHERTAFALLSSCPRRRPTTSGYFLGMSTTRRRRLALIALVILAAGGCLALGWWQWTRFQSTSGTFQNLGYALQWPAFAGFCVYAYRKFVRYEEAPPEHRNTHTVNEIPDGLLPERPKAVQQNSDDPALREYNAYLAELAKADNENDRKQNRTTA
jgi:DNA-binding transcriptional regulator of glucitol operon